MNSVEIQSIVENSYDEVILQNIIADIAMISEDDINEAINNKTLHILLKDIMITYLFLLHRKDRASIRDLIYSRWHYKFHTLYLSITQCYYNDTRAIQNVRNKVLKSTIIS